MFGLTTVIFMSSATSAIRSSAHRTARSSSKIPKRPIRQKITGLPAFTTVKGGAYFFLPGLKALRYLAALGDAH